MNLYDEHVSQNRIENWQKYNFPPLYKDYTPYKVGPYKWILKETFATNTYNFER